jgi:23S rRNA pseudouridine2605 synthase
MAAERLQKVLARAGVASRRRSEQLIVAGRVRVDGRVVTELGVSVDVRRSRIDVDGQQVTAEPFVYLAWHKPREVMSTMKDPEGRSCVADFTRTVAVRVVPVGRLDFHTSGLMLLTNDGELASKLSHPGSQAPKEYVAKVKGVVGQEAVERWQQSIVIDGRATRPAEVRKLREEGDKTWLSIVLREGRNRQVRRLAEAAGYHVMRLARVAYAGISLEGLKPGQWRHLTVDELKDLKRRFGVPARVRPAVLPERQRTPKGPKRASGAAGRQTPSASRDAKREGRGGGSKRRR